MHLFATTTQEQMLDRGAKAAILETAPRGSPVGVAVR
jgi:hypothetical protein